LGKCFCHTYGFPQSKRIAIISLKGDTLIGILLPESIELNTETAKESVMLINELFDRKINELAGHIYSRERPVTVYEVNHIRSVDDHWYFYSERPREIINYEKVNWAKEGF
jgi:hypothetical protein